MRKERTKKKSRFTFVILFPHILLFCCRLAFKRPLRTTSNSFFSAVHDVNVHKYLRQTSVVRRFPEVLSWSTSCNCRADYAPKVKATRAEPFSSHVTFFRHVSQRKGGVCSSKKIKAAKGCIGFARI